MEFGNTVFFLSIFLRVQLSKCSPLSYNNDIKLLGLQTRMDTVGRLMEALFLNFFLSRSSSCCPRFLELISIVLILETLDLCLFFLNFKEAVNQR